MKITIAGTLLGCTALMLGHLNSDAVASRGDSSGCNPDVIVGSLHNITKYGIVGGISAYAVGTTSCNQGCDYLIWEQNSNLHPTIGQNAYMVRELENGCTRIEQIGMSWLKHGFCALQQQLCGPCDNPGGFGCTDILGWNCSDPYDSYFNGQQNNLGPRPEVNASIGSFPWPFTSPAYPQTIGRRLQIQNSLLDEDNYPGLVRYFVEGHYVHPEDAAACMSYNNASYRPVEISGSGNNGYNINLTETTRQMQPAIFAWQEVDPSVEIREYTLSDCAQSGRNETFFVGSKVCQLDNGRYHYEYAVYNLDCDVSFSKFGVPANDADNLYQFYPKYHSGDGVSVTRWSQGIDDSMGMMMWRSKTSSDANAIMYNSMHTFSFDSNAEPTEGQAMLGLFKSGEDINIDLVVPSPVDPVVPCDGDIDGNCVVNGQDLAYVLGNWGSTLGDLNGDALTNGQDLAIVLADWDCTCQ